MFDYVSKLEHNLIKVVEVISKYMLQTKLIYYTDASVVGTTQSKAMTQCV